MRTRSFLALMLAPVTLLSAQDVRRWNTKTVESWSDEAPAISVWMEGGRSLGYGDAVRVRFRAEDDAYVIVGRVDSEGRLTILFPRTRTARTMVRGGEEYLVQGRRTGSFASFVAAERMGSGFVFALASYEPLNLSRLQQRDWEQGGYVSEISRRYYGNASRIIERFAPWVLYSPDAPYEYDIDYYSVGVPTQSTSLAFCQLGYNPFGSAFAYSDMCRYGGGIYSAYCYAMYGAFWGGSCNDWLYWRRNQFVTQGPPPTPTTPAPTEPTPNVKLIDRLQPPDIEGHKSGQKAVVTEEALKRGDLPTRPMVTERGDDDFDRIYSIPRRTIENIKREERIERTPVANGGGFGDERGARSTPGDRGGRRDDVGGRPFDRLLPSTRSAEGPRYEPPPRETPRHFDAPSTRSFDPPGRGGGFDGGRNFDPPPRAGGGAGGGGGFEGSRTSSPSSSPGGRAEHAPPPVQAPPVKEPPATSEKKPEKPEKQG